MSLGSWGDYPWSLTSHALILSTNKVKSAPSATGLYPPSQGVADSVFYCVVQSFPRHDIVKLKEEMFLQWQHQMKLIIELHDLTGFILGTVAVPPRFFPYSEGKSGPNLDFTYFKQKDKLLASWIVSTISRYLLSSFTGPSAAHEVWSKASQLFVVASDAKIFRIKHELYALKRGNLTVTKYLAKIKLFCDLLVASGHPLADTKQIDVVFTGLSIEFNSVVMMVTFALESMRLDLLVEVLLDCENIKSNLLLTAQFRSTW
ncbi:hypothetical protein PVK06_004913 [Gossypium arboreum]|uniref:Retrotransposon gag domain-containing protein n=1 Tax=Gossypium arboreum TaxID=29729 RepID=A0ABR0QU55_GOSAR|nr:hypothetical protein PVK06_004913 [Gossypium arboreum]